MPVERCNEPMSEQERCRLVDGGLWAVWRQFGAALGQGREVQR